MMMRKAVGRKRGGAHTGHGWFVTFADLMGLLVSFFVMLVAFSTQDTVKLQVVAGSMRDAFGVQDRIRYSGVIEVPGLPTRPTDTAVQFYTTQAILGSTGLKLDADFKLVDVGAGPAALKALENGQIAALSTNVSVRRVVGTGPDALRR